jgi:hypothetical protein
MGQIAAIVERAARKICKAPKSLLAEKVDYDWRALSRLKTSRTPPPPVMPSL